jgi:NAD(P)-dependent dehydrogenase (short-subunit alcohol dehydrogenase family)
MERFASKTCLITGAAGSIGEATARRFVTEGGSGTLVDRDDGVVELAALLSSESNRPIRSLVVDLTSPDAIERIDARLTDSDDKLDVLVNCAGIGDSSRIEESTADIWQTVFDINLKSMFLVSQTAAPHMRERSCIVNIGSLAGLRVRPSGISYSASKAGVHHITRVLAVAMAPRRIRVNAVAPGPIKTELNRARWSTPEGEERMLQGVLTGSLGSPEDVADAVLFLAAPSSHLINGVVLPVDGGASVAGYSMNR